MKINFVLGTRPEIIKMSSLIRYCQKTGIDYYITHTNQHYDDNLDKIFFKELELPPAKYNLHVGSGNQGEQTGKMLIFLEEIFQKDRPDIVLVQGDTNSALAGALAAKKLHIKVGHIEAGLRSYDELMPEETNRILIDHCSDLLFAPTKKSAVTLKREGILLSKIYVTGNTVVDAVMQHIEISKKQSAVLETMGLTPGGYIVLTCHRQENVDNPIRFQGILEGMAEVSKWSKLPIIYPIHPRAQKMIETFGLKVPSSIRLVDPLGYLEFLQMQKQARLVCTDSGGLQEESCILGVPCVTLRDNTERPETLDIGSNILAGTNPRRILSAAKYMLKERINWRHPYGDGRAYLKIFKYLT